jgi:hypothetical protein
MRAAALMIVTAGTLLGLGSIALGQSALGDGRAIGDGRGLDRSSRAGSGRGNDARVNLGEELRFRNSIVTGNAPGGLSFRGNVGYRAPGEFLASSGSDATFGFRRDAALSGLGGQGLRGTDALQYQFSLTGGNRPPAGVSRLDSNRLSFDPLATQEARSSNTRLDRQSRSDEASIGGAVRDDNRGLALSALRSPSAFNSTRNLQPSLMGTATSPTTGETMGVTASSLRGISTEKMGDRTPKGFRATSRVGETPEGELESGGNQGQDRAIDRATAPGVISTEQTGEAGEGPRAGRTARPVFEAEFDRAYARVRPTEAVPFADKMKALRESLDDPTGKGPRGARTDGMGLPGESPQQQTGEQPGEAEPGQDGRTPEQANPESSDGEKGDGSADDGLPSGAAAALRDLKVEIPNFAPEGFDAYAEHMTMGQKLLSSGRYFDAEERFTAALSSRPGDPTASLARVNASLGATLFRSAALNLRSLLFEKPEVAAVRFGRDTLPPPQRMNRIKAMLRQTLEQSQGPGARDTGLLLAYVGLHSKDAAAIAEGLKAMSQPVTEGDDANADRMIKLGTLLEAVWVLEPEGGVKPQGAGEGATPQGGR